MSRLLIPSRDLILPSRCGPRNRHRQRGFIINPFLAGGSSSVPPESLSNLTFKYDGNASPHWKTVDTTGGAANADNDTCFRVDSISVTTRTLCDVAGVRQIPLVNGQNGFELTSALGGTPMRFYTKPANGVTPSAVTTIGTLFTNAAATCIMVVKVNNTLTDTGNPYGNGVLLGDIGGYLGLYCYKTGANVVFQAFSYTAGNHIADTTSMTIPLGTWVVLTFIHRSGNIYIRVNGVQIATASAGNTDNVTNAAMLGQSVEGEWPAFCTYNLGHTDANCLLVEKGYGAAYGIPI